MKSSTLPPLTLYPTMAFAVTLACLGLGYIDHETRSIADLFTLQNIVSLFLYFTPAFIASVLFYRHFSRKHFPVKSLVYALLAGVPVGFTFVILLFVIFGSAHIIAM